MSKVPAEFKTSSAMAKNLAGSLLMLYLIAFLSLEADGKKLEPAARREDIPFIKCQTCEKLAVQIHHQVKRKERDQNSSKTLSEFQIIEIAENVCNLKKEEADWILKIDIVEKGDRLELVEQGVEGQCNSKCKTIERACQQVMGYSDTDVAEFMFKKNPSIDLLINFLCHEVSGACIREPPPVPLDRIPGEPFVPKPSKDAEMERVLRSMEGMPGAPSMKMYSRDDLMNMNNFGDEDEDDDDDDNEKFPSDLGKVLRERSSVQMNLKLRIVQGVAQTGKMIKGRANKMFQDITKWWRKMKGGSKVVSKGEL